jgi:glucose-6-phosphate isomerase
MIWGIDPFDQWGVELGKVMANQLAPLLTGEKPTDAAPDPSTRRLIERYRAQRGRA